MVQMISDSLCSSMSSRPQDANMWLDVIADIKIYTDFRSEACNCINSLETIATNDFQPSITVKTPKL